jgi:asparagine synthetase B (glutamine-hydrolysing)
VAQLWYKSAEGSDEQFAGYTWIVQHYNVYEKYWKHYIKLPETIRKSAYYAAKPILSATGKFWHLIISDALLMVSNFTGAVCQFFLRPFAKTICSKL